MTRQADNAGSPTLFSLQTTSGAMGLGMASLPCEGTIARSGGELVDPPVPLSTMKMSTLAVRLTSLRAIASTLPQRLPRSVEP